MLDDHNSLLNQKLFRIIIDQLPVDVDIGLIGGDFVDFLFHFHLFSLRDFCYLF